MEKPEIKETGVYENCMDLLTDEYQPPTLNRFFGESEEDENSGVDTNNVEWKKHWVGMPSFEQNEKKIQKVYFHGYFLEKKNSSVSDTSQN